MGKATKPYARLIRVGTTRMDGGCLFGSTTKENWEQFVTPDRQNRVGIGNYIMLIDHPDGWVLVNAGPGIKPPCHGTSPRCGADPPCCARSGSWN